MSVAVEPSVFSPSAVGALSALKPMQSMDDGVVTPGGVWGRVEIEWLGDGIDVGTTGTLRLILDKKENVLSLPVGAVNYADGKPYVYVLDDNGFKQMVWVSAGLIGDDLVEITSGLSEGDKVVYR